VIQEVVAVRDRSYLINSILFINSIVFGE